MDAGHIKSLAFDLDNTLLDRSKRIGPRTWNALQAWLDSGSTLFLATSRPIRSVRRNIPSELLDRCILITLNGSISQSPGEEPRTHGSIRHAAHAVLGHAWISRHTRLSVEIDGLAFGSNVALTDVELSEIHSATRDMLIPLGEFDHSRIAKVAMENAADAVKQVADHIIGDCDLDPIGPFLETAFPWLSTS